MENTNWEERFDEKFGSCFNIGVVPDDITKQNIKAFISDLLKQEKKKK